MKVLRPGLDESVQEHISDVEVPRKQHHNNRLMRWLEKFVAVILLCIVAGSLAGAQQKISAKKKTPPKAPATKAAKAAPKVPFIAPEEGMAVISAALDARTRLVAKADCSHLVHDIYERAGFTYDYVNSDDLYAGTDKFKRVWHPQPGDLVVWPGHVGIVVNPAQRSFYSALTTGLGIDEYDSAYWKDRGTARFFRFVKTASTAPVRAAKTKLIKQEEPEDEK